MAVLELIWNSEAQNEEVRVSRKKAFTQERGFPGGSDGKEPACNAGDRCSILGQEDPLEKRMATTPVFLPGEFHGQRSLVGYSPWGHKESDTKKKKNRGKGKKSR